MFLLWFYQVMFSKKLASLFLSVSHWFIFILNEDNFQYYSCRVNIIMMAKVTNYSTITNSRWLAGTLNDVSKGLLSSSLLMKHQLSLFIKRSTSMTVTVDESGSQGDQLLAIIYIYIYFNVFFKIFSQIRLNL